MTEPRLFHLQRDHDVSGVSGTGRVADGVLWPDGSVSIRWRGDRPSAVHWDRLADADAVHGHGGATRIVWADEQPPADRAAVLREAADAVFALEYDVMVGEEGDENLGSMREAWDVGTIHATQLLRHMADATATTETQPATLSPAERTMLDYALNQAQERIWADDGFTDEDQAAVDSLRRLTAEEPAAGARQDGVES